MKRNFSLGLVIAFGLTLPLSASTFLSMSQEDLLRQSSAVVEGKVLRVDSFWNDTQQVIVSEALIQVDSTLVGKADSIVAVRTFGGEVDGFRVEAHGFPSFAVDDRVLVFLEPDAKGVAKVTGYQQGLFRIVTDENGVDVAIPAVELETNIVTLDGQKASVPAAQTLAELAQSILDDAAALGR